MAPKNKPSKKTESKAKAQIIEDKTFGLKNKKKSAKVAQYIKSVEKTVNDAGNRKSRKDDEAKQQRLLAKKAEEQRKAEMASLFKPVVVQKVPPGVDPKSVLCQFFKAGSCLKGDKCKFSHDPNIGRKSAKIDLYSDTREEKEKDLMESWDQTKLESVIQQKQKGNQTDIVCKYFLDAIETKKYGWFWECPNGGDKCKYRHALPPGFVLKKTKPSAEKSITLEEFLEVERHNLGPNLTPVTLESFTKWKEDRKLKQAQEEKQRMKKKEADLKAGKLNASGRDLFTYQPDLFADDDEAADDIDYSVREDEEGIDRKMEKVYI